MKVYRPEHEMAEDDMVAGVVYAAAAEQVIQRQFSWENHYSWGPPYQPTVIGYMVEVDDDKGEMDDTFRIIEEELAKSGDCTHFPTREQVLEIVKNLHNKNISEPDEQWGLKGGVDDVEDDKGCECSYFCRGKIDETKQIQARKGATGVSEWSQVDLDRKGVLCNIPVLNDLQLKELAAINRRLGHDVTR